MGQPFLILLLTLTPQVLLSKAAICVPECSNGNICVNRSNKTSCVSDPCAADLQRCNGHGTCRSSILDDGVTYRCDCVVGYTGNDCSSFSSNNGCYRSPCQFSGVCIPVSEEDYTCSCDGTGHFGRHCEIEDLCATNPCINGVCELISMGNTWVTSRRCRCRPGFTGQNCELDIDECAYSPCQNGMECENLAGSYRCHCSSQFTGINCSIPIGNMCSPTTCLNRGICRTGKHGPICDCPPGWSGDFCQVDVDECRTRTCQNGGTCLDHSNGTSCLCLPGWSGPNCEIDVNECSQPGSKDLCKNNGDCINVNGSYYCVCPIGYTGRDCSIVVNMCDRKANLSCLNGGVCKSEIGYYRCQCTSDWQGTYCEQRNPCAKNPCINGGSCTQLFDDPENYRCYCAAGFTGPNCQSDIDECQMNPCGVGNGATCENTVGSFICNCPPGLTGQFCSETAVFNCSAFQPCTNGGTCVSKIGGYKCICPRGFTGATCETNIDECARNPCQNSGTCIDGIGTYKCVCATSFTGRRCETVIDLCASDRDYCYHGGRCITTTDRLGNRRAKCQCLFGYIGDRCEGNVNECASKPCNAVGTSTCADLIGDYLCLCYPGYTGRKCETKIGDANPIGTVTAVPDTFHVAEKCSPSCVSKFGNGQCDVECNTLTCNYDGGDCAPDFGLPCPTGCESAFSNGICDPICNTKSCLWDGNDCLLDPLEKSLYITGIKATYPMSCQTFHSRASSFLLYNLSSLVGAVTREEPQSLLQNNAVDKKCQVSLIFDKTRCARDSCPKSADEYVNFVKKNPQEGIPGEIVSDGPTSKDGPSTNQIIIASIVCSGALIICALILACVLHGKRVRTKTWFPPGFFDVLRLTDQNTSHNPAKQRKLSSSTTASNSVITQATTAGQGGQVYNTNTPSSSAYFDTGSVTVANGMMLMTPPDRRELDLVDPPGPDGLTPLMLACTSSHLSNPPQRVADIVHQLILRGANPLAKTVQREESALHLAARYRNSVALRILLDFCPDPNVRDAEGKTPLHSAVGADAQDCMRWLLRHRMIHIDARMNDGTTSLILATRLCLNSLLTDLVRCNAKLDTQDSLGRTALHWAAAVDNVEAIHLLARHGADKDAQDAREQTPLFLACREGNTNSVTALLEIGCQRDLADHADVTPRQAAVEAGYREVVRLIDEYVPEAGGTTQSPNNFMLAQMHQQQPPQVGMPSTSQQPSSNGPVSVKVEAPTPTVMYRQGGDFPASAAAASTDKGSKLYVDLPPPYSEKASVTVTPGAESTSSQWATSSTWASQQQQLPAQQPSTSTTTSTISPQHQQANNHLPENFLTPSPDNHSTPSSTSPSNQQPQQPVVTSIAGLDVQSSGSPFYSTGLAGPSSSNYGTQPPHRHAHRRHNNHHQQQSLLTTQPQFPQQFDPNFYSRPLQYPPNATTPYGGPYFFQNPQQQQPQQQQQLNQIYYQQPVPGQPSTSSRQPQQPGSDPVYF